MGAASALSRSLTERSTKEETPIARAVSGSLCVCVRKLRSLLEYSMPFIRGATICLHRFVKDGEYQKEIRGILQPTWRESRCCVFFLGAASVLS